MFEFEPLYKKRKRKKKKKKKREKEKKLFIGLSFVFSFFFVLQHFWPACAYAWARMVRSGLLLRFERLGRHIQGKSSSTPVTSDLSKTFHQICLWLQQLVKTRKSAEDSVIYLLDNPQCDVGDWLTLINKLDTIATYSIQRLRVNNNKPLLTMCAHAYAHAGQKCRHTEQKIKK